MTDRNRELRALVTKVENACTSCLMGQPHDDDDCERMLVKTLSNIADMTGEFAGMAEIEIYDIDWDIDGEDVGLPRSVRMMVYASHGVNEDMLSDELYDEYGWLVNGFKWRRI